MIEVCQEVFKRKVKEREQDFYIPGLLNFHGIRMPDQASPMSMLNCHICLFPDPTVSPGIEPGYIVFPSHK
jgi:hypothetical protein